MEVNSRRHPIGGSTCPTMPERDTQQSPFERPAVTHGYPLDKEEKAAVDRALRELSRDGDTPDRAGTDGREADGQ